jgi:hypothetical protein
MAWLRIESLNGPRAAPLTAATWWEPRTDTPSVPMSVGMSCRIVPLLELYYLGGNAQLGISREGSLICP